MKPTKIFVKPARPGMNLQHPVSGALPDEGRKWVDDSFTRRRIAEGGITIAAPDDDGTSDAAEVRIAPVPSPLIKTASEK